MTCPALYLPARIASGELGRLKRNPAQYRLAGFNVAAPLKEEAAVLCDSRTEAARDTESVNTVRVQGDLWLGHNTDCGSIHAVLTEAWDLPEPPAQAIILGSGVAARSAVYALFRWSVPHIAVFNRSPGGRRRMLRWLDKFHTERSGQVEVAPLANAEPYATSAAPGVWICCLPASVAVSPFLPLAVASGHGLLLDLRYGRQLPNYEPPWGCRLIDGKPVLLMKGGLSFAWWFGLPVPWHAMRAALNN